MKRVSSGSPLEPQIGFCRLVRAGSQIWIAGTAPIAADGSCACPNDVYGQTMRCIEIARVALQEAGADLGCIVRTRIMLTDMASWREAARAHGEVFSEIRPVCTFVEISRFIDPQWLVEIEFDGFVG